ncbi:MAG: BlaI/MecI/CopY family transcriptional regulator [Candidatus Aenigmarchaeota archaeon]|nr:BlaI/MecI/CopY family transcriptional regulator [Candidatus Aenigmarchaeota archaeon]
MFRSIRFEKKNLGLLSPLEDNIMEILWKNGDMRVRDVHKKMNNNNSSDKLKTTVPLTSIAVNLDRLHSRKMVKRKIETGRGGDHYIYSPLLTEEDFHKSVLDQTVDKLIETFGSTAVAYFNQRFDKGTARKAKK